MSGAPFTDHVAILAVARRVLELEAAAVSALVPRLDEAFVRAVEVLENCTGRVVVSGIGKSGIIARKLAATLTSTGTPATFVHPVEGLHGDLGILSGGDVAVLVSKSGDTEELHGLLECLLRAGVPIIALVGRMNSILARHAVAVLDCAVEEEACPMDLAPTTSTTAALAMADALAVTLLERKDFDQHAFQAVHPGGSIGRRLTVRVDDVMVSEGYPVVTQDKLIRDCIVPLAKMRGTVPIVDAHECVVGVITAGDLTRLMERTEDFLETSVSEVMTRDPRRTLMGDLGAAAVHTMEEYGIMAMPVVDEEGRLKGLVHLHDLLRSGL